MPADAGRAGTALWLEGVAGTPAEALELVEDGQIPLITNHDAGGVGPMAGVVNPSMPVWVAHDEATGKVAWCPLNEGSGAVLRYGADGPGGPGAPGGCGTCSRRSCARRSKAARGPPRPARALAGARRRGPPPHRGGHRADARGARASSTQRCVRSSPATASSS